MKYELSKFDDLKTTKSFYMNKCLVEKSMDAFHAHDFIEIAYISSGKGKHIVGGTSLPAARGSLFVIEYAVPHRFIPEQPLLVYNCVFKPDFLDHSLTSCRDFFNIVHHSLFCSMFPHEFENLSEVNLFEDYDNEIEKIYEKMFIEYGLKQIGFLEIIKAQVIELIIRIFRSYQKRKCLSDRIENKRSEIIKSTLKYIACNCDRHISLEELSSKVFLSPGYLSTLFKDATGSTILEHLQKVRIENACRLLADTNRNITDIAECVGYYDIKHFYNIFKKVAGKTPGEFRKYCI